MNNVTRLFASILCCFCILFGCFKSEVRAGNFTEDCCSDLDRLLKQIHNPIASESLASKSTDSMSETAEAISKFGKHKDVLEILNDLKAPNESKRWLKFRSLFGLGKDEEALEELDSLGSSADTRHWDSLLENDLDVYKRSNHWIYYDNCSEQIIKSVHKVIDGLVQNRLRKLTRLKLSDLGISRIYLFFDEDRYSTFVQAMGLNPKVSYHSKFKIVVLNVNREDFEKQFRTEFMRSLIWSTVGQYLDTYFNYELPLWMQHGLLEYFSSTAIGNNGPMKPGSFFYNPNATETWDNYDDGLIKEDKFNKLVKFISAEWYTSAFDKLSVSGLLSSRNYQKEYLKVKWGNRLQIWSFIHYLIHDRKIQKKSLATFGEYFKRIRDGESASNAQAHTFSKLINSRQKIDKEWRDHIQSNMVNYRIDLP